MSEKRPHEPDQLRAKASSDQRHWRPAERLDRLARRLVARPGAPRAYLDELETRFEEREPDVLSMVPEEGRFERLGRQLTELEQRFPDPDLRPPLFGIPVAIKDVFHVDGFATGGGSRLPAGELAGKEAPCVTDLRRAGALILGKAACTELAYFAPGPTRNPCHLAHTPGGSSSGSAAAVAAGLSPLSLGTQTIGSVGRPAAFCGVVGYKPTFARVSTAGVVPLGKALDHVGWFTSDASGAALAAQILITDWNGAAEGAAEARQPILAVAEGPHLQRTEPAALAAFEEQVEALGRAGIRIHRLQVMDDFDEIEARHRLLLASEFYRAHQGLYRSHGESLHSATRRLLERGRDVDPEAASAALEGRDRLRQELEDAMDGAGVDLLLAPSATGTAPLGLESTGDPVLNLPFTHAGLPALTLPAGRLAVGDRGYSLPVGVQLVGRLGRDESLLAWGQAIEGRLRPKKRS